MKKNEILEELRTVISGKTFDAILPPLVFVVINSFFGLDTAVYVSIGLALLLGVNRLLRKQAWQYALGGLLGVLLASGLAYLTRNAASYFIPAIAGSAILLVIAILTLISGKPLAAWASHITRGWPLEWFWRKDIKPAYLEVTIIWTFLLSIRLIIQLFLFQSGDTVRLAWTNTLLGWPVTIIVLIISYIYGIWRLRNLGGPGVDEFKDNKKPPWQGQTRGF